MTSQNLLIGDDNFISVLKNIIRTEPSYRQSGLRVRQCAWIKIMKIACDSMHTRCAIQLNVTYSEMLMVVREPERSFDGEDS